MFLAFLFSIISYSLILGFFAYFLVAHQKPQKQQIVYVHKAIYKPTQVIQKPKQNIQKQTITKEAKKQEIKTNSSFSKGGDDIKFDDIFSNVTDNVKTTKIQQKKQAQMTKKIGESLKQTLSELKKLKKAMMSVSNISGKKSDLDYLQAQLSQIWAKINTIAGDFIKVYIQVRNHQLSITIIATNLDPQRLEYFKSEVQKIDTSKINNFGAQIDFKAVLQDKKAI
jgi:hypothetical protein